MIFDEWILSGRAIFLDEPAGIDKIFRSLTSHRAHSPKVWADTYLVAFAEAAGLTFVTFDRALAGKAKGAILLA